MQLQSRGELDTRLNGALDEVGLIGQQLRASLIRDLKAKIVLRSARDAVEVIGASGTGRRSVVEAAHVVARDVLGRSGPLTQFDCDSAPDGHFDTGLRAAIEGARGGTLMLDHFGSLPADAMARATRLIRNHGDDALILAVSEPAAATASSAARPATAIRLQPLHKREEDIWELIDHFFEATCEDADLEGCRGFSRQAKADIAEVARETSLNSVRRLRDLVRDLVFEAFAAGAVPLKLTSEQVRPTLERTFGQTQQARAERDAALVDSQFDALVEPTLCERLADAHGIPEDVLRRQAAVLQEVVGHLDDMPKSYRNIMTKAEDVQRAALWLVTGAKTQAGFRRFFGDEGFMRPTKSVAWAFYNRVFKRDM